MGWLETSITAAAVVAASAMSADTSMVPLTTASLFPNPCPRSRRFSETKYAVVGRAIGGGFNATSGGKIG